MLRILFLVFITIPCAAQQLKDIMVKESDNGKVLSDFLMEIENAHDIDFICDEQKMRALTVTGITEKQRLIDYFERFSNNYKLQKISEKIIFIVESALVGKYSFRKENFLVLKKTSKPKIQISGNVIDGSSGEPLIGARIFISTMQHGELTNGRGEFTIDDTPMGILPLDIEYVGYVSNNYVLGFSPYATSDKISATLFPVSKELQSVTITADRVDENITSLITGVEKLDIETIKSIPRFLGEVDPIRSLTTLPGVSTSGELASGFNVRGGETGQNLILQDGAIIYNPSHLFGFFSAFNPDMVNNVVLYKGGGPANFGSRISSILDISLKNGAAGKHSVSAGVGLISSRLSLEGPILKNRSSYIIGGRFSYCNWLVRATDNISLKNSAAGFRDLTAKVFHTVNEKNFLTFSAYNSYDDFKLATDSVFSWGTTNFSMKWDHTFNEKTFSSLTASSSDYYSEVQSQEQIEAFNYNNSIKNIGFKYDLTHTLNENFKILEGIELARTVIEPGKLEPAPGMENVIPQNMQDQRMIEGAGFFEIDVQVSQRFSMSAGLRYSNFLRLGKESIYTYNYSTMNGRYPSIQDTIYFDSNEVIKAYSGLEPRLSLKYSIGDESSLKVSYYRGYQYMHLISNTTSTTPQDYWIASSMQLKPQSGNQFSLGYFKNFKANAYEFSLEGFYKTIANAVDYIEGADITLNPILETGLSQGDGLAYGIELFFKKKVGKLQGWFSYTYSRSLRRFESGDNKIEINNGEYYAAAWDQPNIISLIMNYHIGIRTTLSANFNYSTGRPITIPISKFSYDVYLSVLNYSERNEYRIPDYHRLDLSLTFKGKPRKNKNFNSEWIISVFNLYGRKNTYSISFNRYGSASKLSILGSIFPSLTYAFRF